MTTDIEPLVAKLKAQFPHETKRLDNLVKLWDGHLEDKDCTPAEFREAFEVYREAWELRDNPEGLERYFLNVLHP